MQKSKGAKLFFALWQFYHRTLALHDALCFSQKKPSCTVIDSRENGYFCDMSKQDKIINKIIGIATASYPDSEIFLYGSRARGNAKISSDWDLLILLNTKSISFALETKIMDEFYELELETGEIFSPLIYSKKDWTNNYSYSPLYENIQKQGIQIK